MKYKYCSKCGSRHEETSSLNFCGSCGNPMSREAVAKQTVNPKIEPVVEVEREEDRVPHITKLSADIFTPNTKFKGEEIIGSGALGSGRRRPTKKYSKNKEKFFEELQKEFIINRDEDQDFEKEND